MEAERQVIQGPEAAPAEQQPLRFRVTAARDGTVHVQFSQPVTMITLDAGGARHFAKGLKRAAGEAMIAKTRRPT